MPQDIDTLGNSLDLSSYSFQPGGDTAIDPSTDQPTIGTPTGNPPAIPAPNLPPAEKARGAVSMALAIGPNPDIEAADRDIARRTGLPLDVVKGQPDLARQRATMNSIDFGALAKDYPTTASFMSNLSNAQIAHDDIHNLAGLEQATQNMGFFGTLKSLPWEAFKGVGGSFNKLGSAINTVLGAFPTMYDKAASLITGRNTTSASDWWWKNMVDPMVQRQQQYAAGDNGKANLAQKGANLAGSLLGMFSQIALTGGAGEAAPVGEVAATSGTEAATNAATDAVTHATKSMAVPAVSDAIDTGRQVYQQTGDGAKAVQAAVTQYLVSTGQGIVPLSAPGKWYTRMLTGAGSGVAAGEISRDAMNWALPDNMQQSADLDDRILSAIAGAAMGGVMGPRPEHGALRQSYSDISNAQAAVKDGESLDQINQLSAASKLRERDPQTFQDFIKQATDNGPVQDVYIDPYKFGEVLNQSGVDPLEVAQQVPAVKDQIEQAMATGQDIRIPIDEFATHMAGEDYSQAMIDHLKTDPNGMTRAEAQDFLDNHVDKLKQDMNHILQEKSGDDAFKQSQQAVEDNIRTQLEGTGRFSDKVNNAYAKMVAAHYGVRAAQLGMTPEELFTQHPLRVQAEPITGSDTLNQSGERRIPIVELPESELFTEPETKLPSAARGFYKENYQDKPAASRVRNDSLGADISFSSVGKGKFTSFRGNNNSRLRMSVVKVLPDLAKHAVVYDEVGDYKDRRDIDGYTYAVAPLRSGDKLVAVRLILRRAKSADGAIFYQLHGYEIEQGELGGRNESSTSQFGPGDQNRVAPLDDGEVDNSSINLEHLVDAVKNGKQLFQAAFSKNRGAYSTTERTISLLKNADLSTFLHESGHHFLEMTADLASRPDAPEEIKKDFSTLLKWFGVQDENSWHALDFEEKRAYHEQFARGFEHYLMEGKAPSPELAGVFSRFRAWMLHVYTSLKNLNVKLSDDVRNVMDRMLASSEQIKDAEQARSLMPLFESADQAGMTPDQWRAYREQSQEATQNAISNLESRSVRDMKWLSNARDKMLKKLQKEADTQRRKTRMEVTKEVLSQPLYRARAFLKGPVEGGATPETKKSAKNPHIDARVDSLHTAIAKAGGLNKDDLVSTWGIDPKEKAQSGVFGKPVLRKSGGKSIDHMASVLAHEGYIRTDEHGHYDLHELEEKFKDEMAGDAQYSMNADYDRLLGDEADHGQVPRETLEQLPGGRLSLPALKEMYGDGPDAVWRKLPVGKYGMVANDGIHPDLVAEMFGIENGDQLVHQLVDAPHPKEVIDGMTDQRMLEEHGDLVDPQSLQDAVDRALHNEARSRFVSTELNALQRALSVKKPNAKGRVLNVLPKIAKQLAQDMVAKLRVRDIRSDVYTAAESRAARNAQDAMKKGDLETAAAEKRNELINGYAAKAAMDAREEVAKGVDYLKKFDKPTVREDIDLEYRDQIDQLLEQYDLRKGVSGRALDKRESLLNFVERQAALGYETNIPDKLLADAQLMHYKDMPIEQFRGLVDAVKNLEHLGRLKTRIKDVQEERRLQDVVNEAVQAMRELKQSEPESNRGLTRMQSVWLKTKSFGRSAQASLLKMEQMFDWLDNRNPNGVFNRVVFRRLSEAGVKQNDLLVKVKSGIDELMHANLKDVTKDGGKIYVAEGLIDGMTGQPQRFTKKEMLALAGNMGNDSNVAKLLAGEAWSEHAVWDFLNKNMSKADWDYVAGIGKALESLWPEKVAMMRRLGNSTPDKIEPRPFDTPHGRYDGWYWPMIYDPARSQDVAERGARKADQLFENTYARANTDTGRTITRNENYARPLLLSLDALPKILSEEIHDITHREAILDADKLLSRSEIRDAIVSALSQEHYDQIRPWLQAIANDGRLDDSGMRALKFFNAVAHGARTRATIVGLGYRLSTMLVHGMSAGLESVAELGPKWMASGLADFANPTQLLANKDFIFERSGEMRNRMNEVDRDVREHLREIDLRMMDPATGAIQRGSDIIKSHAYWGIAMLDMASALPTWMGAYKKAMSSPEKGGLGMSEEDAVQFADKTVRNAHGGTGVKDLAAVQRGPEFFKLFTMFYTFWNHNVNRIMDTARLAGELPSTFRSGNLEKFRGDLGMVIMRTLVYTLGIQVMHGLLHHPKDGADEDSWLAWAGKELASAATSGIPIFRDLAAHYIQGKDYSVTPAASMVDAVGQSGQDAMHAVLGEKTSDKWLKHAITTTGYVFGLPTGQAASAIQFLYDVEQGNQHPESIQDWWHGVLHGDIKKH